jgi:hypothetical protein
MREILHCFIGWTRGGDAEFWIGRKEIIYAGES